MLSRGALCAAAGVRSVAIRAAVAAVASVLQVLKRMTRARIGMAGRYPGQLLGERGTLGDPRGRTGHTGRRVLKGPWDELAHVGRMAIV
ncbi:hypothetical protein GCM10010307_76870 [Streptomyces vastus]|uniref:Uncharacterized protein n=1 Tax=Streptomyces vastus TaxID=285451 RepID=A0ABN3RSX3_9ACTN